MVPDIAVRALQHYFGYREFRPAQCEVVKTLLRGEDCMAIMPTGAGKSICFQVPALLHKGITLVFTPLISLMKDQVDGLLLQNLPAAFLNSSLSADDFGRRVRDLQRGEIKLLYLAPERLDALWFRKILLELPVSQIIIDEAHCVSQWGHDFRPSYRKIAPFIEEFKKKPIVGAFTATATEEVEEDIKRLLHLQSSKVFITGFDRPNLSFHVEHVANKLSYIIRYIEAHKEECGIIYCATRKEVEHVYQELLKVNIKVGYYHAGLDDEIRKKHQEDFIFDRVSVMVATNAFGMGIDKSNVRYILHYQMPRNMESYYQEAGRAGRDGNEGECILLYNGQDVRIQKFLIDRSDYEPHRRDIELQRLQKMIDYCFTGGCLRSYILQYFGEIPPSNFCKNCSSCLRKGEEKNITKEAKAVFRAIAVTEERYGATMITSLLVGVENERIRYYGYHRLPEFGALRDLTEKEIKDLIRMLIATGYIESSSGKYPTLSLMPAADDVLQGMAEVTQIMPRVVEGQKKTSALKKSGKREKGLFIYLREHRKRLAQEEGVPPYLIFSDTVLIDMVEQRPKTLADFYSLKGVGQVKLEKYGMSFLKAISDYKEK